MQKDLKPPRIFTIAMPPFAADSQAGFFAADCSGPFVFLRGVLRLPHKEYPWNGRTKA